MRKNTETIDIPLEVSKSLILWAESEEIQNFIQATIKSGEFEAYTKLSDGKEIGFFFDMDGGFLGTKEEVNDIKFGVEIVYSDHLLKNDSVAEELNPIIEDVLKNLNYEKINETTYRESPLGKLGFIFSFHPFSCKVFVGTEKETIRMLKVLNKFNQMVQHPEKELKKEQRAKKKVTRQRKNS